jgi:hypothetical protein
VVVPGPAELAVGENRRGLVPVSLARADVFNTPGHAWQALLASDSAACVPLNPQTPTRCNLPAALSCMLVSRDSQIGYLNSMGHGTTGENAQVTWHCMSPGIVGGGIVKSGYFHR